MAFSQHLDCIGYHYTKTKGLYRRFVDKNSPCQNDHCQCGGKLYHSKSRHDFVVCEDCGLTYIVILIKNPIIEEGNKMHQY